MVKPYLWIVIVGGIVAFLMGGGMGANDLANAFGATYGAKILTIRQIVVVAAICEFAGAISLGASVTSTLASGIADPMSFKDDPYVLMYGMLCAMGAALTWVSLATVIRLPVSSTHSVAGGIMGFALVYGGGGGVIWAAKISDFPFVKGFVPIVASWFISPLLTGSVAAVFFLALRHLILRPANAVTRATYSLPVIVGITFFLEAFFILFKGAKAQLRWSASRSAWVSACIAAGAALLSIPFIPLIRYKVRKMTEEDEARALEGGPAGDQGRHSSGDGTDPAKAADASEDVRMGEMAVLDDSLQPVDAAGGARSGEPFPASDSDGASRDDLTKKAHADGILLHADGGMESTEAASPCSAATDGDLPPVEVFHRSIEYVFRFLQVFTAICMSFAHGASDVSNSIGPFAAVYSIYQNEKVTSRVDVPIWILCLGGVGIAIGLATFGQRLMQLMGEKITRITPTRGFCAELATALVVSFASGYGIPISSTHSITGAIFALSVVDYGFLHIQWLLALKMYLGWVFTLVVTGLVSAAFFAQGTYAPTR